MKKRSSKIASHIQASKTIRNSQSAVRHCKVCIIGMGLIGGSLGLALKCQYPSTVVHGVVRKRQNVRKVLRCGAADRAFLDPIQGVQGADWIILATNPTSFEPMLKALLPHLKPSQIVTDVGSVKTSVLKMYKRVLGNRIPYIGSHPIAGSEKRGVDAARKDLFEGALCLLTPDGNTSPGTLRKAIRFWKNLKMKPVVMTSTLHDETLALFSHLPHLVSFALSHTAQDWRTGEPANRQPIFGEAWRDMTRIAHSPAKLWSEICTLNREHILRALRTFSGKINFLLCKLRASDEKTIEEFFEEASATLSKNPKP